MPVEIKELHIKAVIGSGSKEQQGQQLSKDDIAKLKKEITNEVTEKVMRKLKQKNER